MMPDGRDASKGLSFAGSGAYGWRTADPTEGRTTMRQRRTRLGWAGVGVALVMVFGACGGDDDGNDTSSSDGGATTAPSGQASAQTPDPCALLTVAEVSAAVGSPIGPPEGTDISPPIGGRTCLFSNTDAPPIKTVQVVVRTNGDFGQALRDQGQTVERLYQDTKTLEDASVVEDVSGLGDRAYKTARAYYVLDDGVALEVNLGLNANPSPEAQAALKSLTEKAVARL
jgi:Protein of unknown function (DUF3558)